MSANANSAGLLLLLLIKKESIVQVHSNVLHLNVLLLSFNSPFPISKLLLTNNNNNNNNNYHYFLAGSTLL